MNPSQNEEPLDGNHQSIINKSVEIIKETNINGDIFEDIDQEGADEVGDYSTLIKSQQNKYIYLQFICDINLILNISE